MSVEVMRSHTNKEGQRPKAATSGGQSSKMHQLVVVYRIWIFFVCLFGSLFAALFSTIYVSNLLQVLQVGSQT